MHPVLPSLFCHHMVSCQRALHFSSGFLSQAGLELGNFLPQLPKELRLQICAARHGSISYSCLWFSSDVPSPRKPPSCLFVSIGACPHKGADLLLPTERVGIILLSSSHVPSALCSHLCARVGSACSGLGHQLPN